jgi:hypothetical protein
LAVWFEAEFLAETLQFRTTRCDDLGFGLLHG